MRQQTNFLATSLCALLVLSLPDAVHAQRNQLDQADSLLQSGRAEQARAALDEWKKANGDAVQTNARFTFLTARLASRSSEAEEAYLTVALSHPTSPYAAESLLRLGQARLANGDARQAMVYLQRLLTDYPRSDHRELGRVWLARAQLASGNPQAACATVTDALKGARAGDAAPLLRAEQSTACAAPVAAPPSPSAAPVPTTAPRTQTVQTPPSGSGRYAIQVAAFRERTGARSVARQLERAGFTGVRLATVPDNSLIRVRVGRFESTATAATTLNQVKAAGFTAVIVADAHREKAER